MFMKAIWRILLCARKWTFDDSGTNGRERTQEVCRGFDGGLVWFVVVAVGLVCRPGVLSTVRSVVVTRAHATIDDVMCGRSSFYANGWMHHS